MDTRFWGPDGWKLLHSVVERYPSRPTATDKETYKIFMNSLKHVLPCIYCRRSLDEYTQNLPVDNFLKNKTSLKKWLYRIHNMVNDKLRKQGLNDKPDPSFEDVDKFYKNYVKEINSANCVNMPGWNFIYSIIFNYPVKRKDIETIRYVNYVIFFTYLGKVLPFDKVKEEYKNNINKVNFEDIMSTRNKFKKWFFNLEKHIKALIDGNCMKYSDRCDLIEMYRAGCGGKRDKKPTCRNDKSKV